MPTASSAFPLASEVYETDTPQSGTEAGAAGDSSGNSYSISSGGMIAIIIVVVVVCLLGISSAVLFYIAKKREWTVKEAIRKSARKVVTALTPRRAEFPDLVKDSRRRHDNVPPTPRLRPEDIEKGLARAEVKRKERR